MFLLVIILIIGLIVSYRQYMKRKYGVWLKMKDGSACIGLKHTNPFGITKAKYGCNIWAYYFNSSTVTLLNDGKCNDSTNTYDNGEPVEWKPYKS